MMNRINRMVLSFVLVTFSSCVVHAAEVSSKDKSAHVEKKDKRDSKKKDTKQKDEDVVYLDMSDADGDVESDMPAITKKGPL